MSLTLSSNEESLASLPDALRTLREAEVRLAALGPLTIRLARAAEVAAGILVTVRGLDPSAPFAGNVSHVDDDILDAIRDSPLQLTSGMPLKRALRELMGLPAPTRVHLWVDARPGDVTPISLQEWRAFLDARCPRFAPEDLDRVTPIFTLAGTSEPERLQKLLSLKADPSVALQSSFFRNRLPSLYRDARDAIHSYWALSIAESDATWSTLFLTLHFDTLVVAQITARLNTPMHHGPVEQPNLDRPSPFVYIMA